MLPSVDLLGFGSDYLFKQNNAPFHVAKSVKTSFENFEVKPIRWLACLPDLNPIEHLWADMDRNLSRRNHTYARWIWGRTGCGFESNWGERTAALVKSMPDRIGQIDARSHWCMYREAWRSLWLLIFFYLFLMTFKTLAYIFPHNHIHYNNHTNHNHRITTTTNNRTEDNRIGDNKHVTSVDKWAIGHAIADFSSQWTTSMEPTMEPNSKVMHRVTHKEVRQVMHKGTKQQRTSMRWT